MQQVQCPQGAVAVSGKIIRHTLQCQKVLCPLTAGAGRSTLKETTFFSWLARPPQGLEGIWGAVNASKEVVPT